MVYDVGYIRHWCWTESDIGVELNANVTLREIPFSRAQPKHISVIKKNVVMQATKET
jgi:hypothetical protein